MRTGRIACDGIATDVRVEPDGQLLAADGRAFDSEVVTWLPPAHANVIGVALNYKPHRDSMAAQFQQAPYMMPPQTPVLFIKPENTITGHRAPVQCPDGLDYIQPGAALAVVIGRTASRIKAERAFDYLKGYTLFNDFSLPEESYFRPPVRSKCYDSFGPLGPWIVDREDVDPRALAVRTRVNGELRQEGNTSELICDIPALLEFITTFMCLVPGDVIATGFPAGRPDVRPGDEVEITVEGVGSLHNSVVSEARYHRDVN